MTPNPMDGSRKRGGGRDEGRMEEEKEKVLLGHL
jgi:hypothetical protein